MTYRISLGIIMGLIFLYPPALLAQMPSQPGTLVINSEPTTGAMVTINGKATGKPTNATFIVSPGTYTVSVGSKGGNPYCAAKSIPVGPGQTAVWLCSGTTWTIQPK